MPTSKGEAFSTSAAVSGSARNVICPPKWTIVSEVHSFTKSGLRQSPVSQRAGCRYETVFSGGGKWPHYIGVLLHSRQPSRGIPMFGRLLPKEGRFFDLFNAHATQVVRAARELSTLLQSYQARAQPSRQIEEAGD